MLSIGSLVSICLTLSFNEDTFSFVKNFVETTFEYFPFLVSFFSITRFHRVVFLLIPLLRSLFLVFSSQEYCLTYHVLGLVFQKGV